MVTGKVLRNIENKNVCMSVCGEIISFEDNIFLLNLVVCLPFAVKRSIGHDSHYKMSGEYTIISHYTRNP